MDGLQNPLDALNEQALYRLIGEAWINQLKARPGEVYQLDSAEQRGKREFEALIPTLRAELERRGQNDLVSAVSRAIQKSRLWRMPASVIAALAIKQGLAPADGSPLVDLTDAVRDVRMTGEAVESSRF